MRFSSHFVPVLLLAIFGLLTVRAVAQPSPGSIGLTMFSKILNREVKYSIYLPPDYEKNNQDFPVVYLLHGNGDDHTAWLNKGQVDNITDKAIKNQDIVPLLLVMPDAGVTYYVNDFASKVRYEDMFIQEFIPFIESEYRIKKEKKYRGIAGLSMGGYGSLLYAIKYPDLFSACVALSAAVRSDEEIIKLSQGEYDRRFKYISGPGLKGTARLTPYYRQHSILDLITVKTLAELKGVRYYLDCGDNDHLTLGNAMLHIKFTQLGVPHEYRSRNGGHEWNYWRTGIIDGLKFLNDSFK